MKKLAHICSNTDALTVRACIRRLPPCAIAKLALSLCEALPLWRCCVDILLCLAHSLEFKRELLSGNPGLLDGLLTKASTSQQNFYQYHDLCVILLSHSLPESVPLPASVQPFFLQVFEQSCRKPGVQTLKPIYCMLNGACRGLLALLPSETSQAFDTQLCRILSSKCAGENSMLLLWCFGIIILAEHPEFMGNVRECDEAIYHAASILSTVKWATASGRKMFGTEIARQKTVTLVCLSVIWALKAGVDVTDDEALQGIRIATCTLKCAGQPVLGQCFNGDSNGLARNSFPKLLEKIQQCGDRPAIQREALIFYATVQHVIGGPSRLCPTTVALYEAALVSMKGWEDSSSQSFFTDSMSLFADILKEAAVKSILCQILTTNAPFTPMDQIQKVTSLANEIAATVVRHQGFRSQLLTALARQEVQEEIETFLAICSNTIEIDWDAFCCNYDYMIRRRSISATIAMLLTIIYTAESDSTLRIPSSLGVALIRRQHQLSVPFNECTHIQSSKVVSSISLFEQECTPLSGLPLQNWRERLEVELENHSSYQRNSLVQAVAQICHDLEDRCDTVEGPLRHEREKSSLLEEELSRTRACMDSLEQKRADDSLFLDALKTEKTRLERENDELSAQLEQLRMELDDSRMQGTKALHKAEEAYNDKVMQLQSKIQLHEGTIKFHEEQLEKLSETTATPEDELSKQDTKWRDVSSQYNSLHGQFKRSQDVVKKQEQAIAQLSDLCSSLQDRLCRTEDSLNNTKHSNIQKDEEISRLGQEVAVLESHLRQAKIELAKTTEILDDLQVRHHELAQSSTKALQEVEAQYESDIEARASQAAREHHQIQSNLQDAYDENSRLNDACEQMQQNLEQIQTSIPPLHIKIQDLLHECEGLRSWKNRVLTSMGLPPESAYHGSQSCQSLQNNQIPQRGLVSESPAATQGSVDLAMDDTANASVLTSSQLSQSDSMLHRSKLYTPHNNALSTTSPSLPNIMFQKTRLALRPISPNRRCTTVGISISKQANEEGGDGHSFPLEKIRDSRETADAD